MTKPDKACLHRSNFKLSGVIRGTMGSINMNVPGKVDIPKKKLTICILFNILYIIKKI